MRQFRVDSVPMPNGLQQYVTPQDAQRHLTGQQEGAEAARLQMLKRMGLDKESGPAVEARERMIQRRENRLI